MARILGGGMFGEMRGKLGSVVFSRNRGGAYSRSYAKPIDPRTIAQLAARNNFGTAASNYHSLDPSTKALWQNFANSVFNPKTGTPGVPSGFNAFVSLQNVVNNARLLSSLSVSADGPPITIETERDFLFTGTPPTNQLQANIGAVTSGSYNYGFVGVDMTNVEITESGLVGFINLTLNLSAGGVGPIGNWQSLTDAAGNNFGFKFYMSNPVAQPNMFINNPYQFDLGSFPSIETDAPVTAYEQTTFAGNFGLYGGNYSALPQLGQYVQLTAFAVSTDGMLLRIGSNIMALNAS